MGKSIESQSIYVDSKKLRGLVRKSIYAMAKLDRPVYGDSLMKETRELVADFAIAYTCEERRAYYQEKLIGDLAVLKSDLEDVMEDNIIKNADKEHLHMSPEALRTEIYMCIAQIDKGLTKWRCGKKDRTDIA